MIQPLEKRFFKKYFFFFSLQNHSYTVHGKIHKYFLAVSKNQWLLINLLRKNDNVRHGLSIYNDNHEKCFFKIYYYNNHDNPLKLLQLF